jgi:hypothetical protein
MLEEDELAALLQDPPDPAERVHHTRYRTRRERADDGVDAGIGEGDAFSRKVQKRDVQVRSAPLPFGEAKHSGVGLERIDLAHSRWVIVSEVRSGTYPDLEDGSLSQGDDVRADIPKGLGIAQDAYEWG